MNLTCPYSHTSYAAWRLQVLRKLCVGLDNGAAPRLSFLAPSTETNQQQVRRFHESTQRTRKYIKDLKRTAKYKAAQLELAKHTESATGSVAHGDAQSSYPRSDRSTWTPYDKDGLEELQDLVADLKAMTKEAMGKNVAGEEQVPSKSESDTSGQREMNVPESPLERRLPWDRRRKLQSYEVDVDKRLQNNAWAQLLASPLRLDRATKARLPKDLMIAYGVVQNPQDTNDYVLPIELSDLEGFKRELQQSVRDDKETAEEGAVRTRPSLPRAGTRIQIQPNKLAVQAMTEDFMFVQHNAARSMTTNSAKLAAALIPYRWRHKQSEMQAFYRTRQNYNYALNRQPDDDEPNVAEMAKLNSLQWQFDMLSRVETIMRERVLIALEALGRDNASGTAIHDRKVSALAVPEDGQLHQGSRGRILGGQGDSSSANTENATTLTPDWIHGAICLHVGKSSDFLATVKQWDQTGRTQGITTTSNNQKVPFSRLIPPMLTINNQMQIPVFNLESLLNKHNTHRLAQLTQTHQPLNFQYWQERSATHDSSKADSGFDSDINATSSDLPSTLPRSSSDAGEQVFSSIVTPGIDAPLLDSSTAQRSTSSSSQATPSSASSTGTSQETVPNGTASEPYLILIKARAKHASVMTREIWQLWRYLGGRKQ